MAKVFVTPTAAGDLQALINELHLPGDMRARVRSRLGQLAQFPERGEELTGRWQGFRYILGPWRWMLILFVYDNAADQIDVVTIQDPCTGASTKSPV